MTSRSILEGQNHSKSSHGFEALDAGEAQAPFWTAAGAFGDFRLGPTKYSASFTKVL